MGWWLLLTGESSLLSLLFLVSWSIGVSTFYREWCGNLTMRRHQKRSLYGSMRSCIHTVYITYDTMFSRRVENYSGCSKRIPRRGNSVITAIFVHHRRAVRMRRSMSNGLMLQLARKCAVTYLYSYPSPSRTKSCLCSVLLLTDATEGNSCALV